MYKIAPVNCIMNDQWKLYTEFFPDMTFKIACINKTIFIGVVIVAQDSHVVTNAETH